MGPGGHDSGRVVGGARASVAPVRMALHARGALGLLRVLPRRVPPVGKHVAAVALVDRRAAPAAAAVMAPLAPAIAAAEVAPFRVPMRLKCEFSDVMEYNTIYNIFGNISLTSASPRGHIILYYIILYYIGVGGMSEAP